MMHVAERDFVSRSLMTQMVLCYFNNVSRQLKNSTIESNIGFEILKTCFSKNTVSSVLFLIDTGGKLGHIKNLLVFKDAFLRGSSKLNHRSLGF